MGDMAVSSDQQKVIDWLLLPKRERRPDTQTALEEELGLGQGTISTWKKSEDFVKAWNSSYLRGISSPATKSLIMNTLLRTATDQEDPKHVAAAKTFFEIEGSLKPQKAGVDVTVTTKPSELTDEQLKRMMSSKAKDELAERREAS